MPQVNPDPHDAGYVYSPTDAVTADFPRGVDAKALARALTEAGFAPDQVQVFQGEAGAEQLDLKGEQRGGWIQVRRGLEKIFADETEIFEQVERVLRSGGVVAAAFTGGDEARKAKAAEVMKSHGGELVRYWGQWTIDRL